MLRIHRRRPLLAVLAALPVWVAASGGAALPQHAAAAAPAGSGAILIPARAAGSDELNQAIRRAAAHRVYVPSALAGVPSGYGPDAPQGVVRIVRDPSSPVFAGKNRIALTSSIRLRSNVRLEIDSGIRIVRAGSWTSDGPMVDLTGSSNVTLTAGDRSAGRSFRVRGRSLGGRFMLDASTTGTRLGTRWQAVVLNDTGNFLVERFHTRQSMATNTAAVVARGDRAPHHGVYRHHSNANSPFGYGANQLVSLRHVAIQDVWTDGGTALRLETDGNAAGVHHVTASRIHAQNGSRIASLTPHCQINDHITLRGLRGVSVYYGVTLGGTPEGSRDKCPTRPGRFLSTVIRDACVVAGSAAEVPIGVGQFRLQAPRGRSQWAVDDRSPRGDQIALRTIGFHQKDVRFARGIGPGADPAAPCRP